MRSSQRWLILQYAYEITLCKYYKNYATTQLLYMQLHFCIFKTFSRGFNFYLCFNEISSANIFFLKNIVWSTTLRHFLTFFLLQYQQQSPMNNFFFPKSSLNQTHFYSFHRSTLFNIIHFIITVNTVSDCNLLHSALGYRYDH